jgi:two-component system sensor histidine kinase PhoQ
VTSLTSRVTLSALVLLAIFITLTGMALERAFHESARLAVSERLSAQLYLIMAEAELNKQGQLVMPDNLPTARLNLPGSGLYAWILDAQHNSLWHSPSVIGLSAEPPQVNRLFVERSINDRLYFISALSVKWENYGKSIPLRFVVVEDTQAYHTELQRFRHSLWFWLGIMAALLLLALAILMVWGLQPLRQAASEVSAIEAGRQRRLNRRYPRELQQLTANINTLLAHEQAQRRRYRETLADLAHSLKTPLAILRSQGTAIDGKMLDEQITRMDDIIQYQLQRAANAGRSALTAPIAILPILDRLIVGLQKVHHDKGVEVIRRINDEPLFRGDSGDLMELVGNLADNAFKWCRKRVIFEAYNMGDQLVLSVADDGPGIDENLQTQIMQRGVRADEAKPGDGIGLAMVRDIVDAYGGNLKMDNIHSSGACVTVMLPGARRD